ncbi:hypothetical protein AB1Y20_002121 [Prymnesium parvum]|uniref:Aminoglycoside phosphotransferase domain-containing protein n=1 Tax=Prymnesium parvum TaxID=97485 RepID=A0AB34J719_PRYPA
MAKADVAISAHSDEEISRMLSAFEFALPLASATRLYGGYSGSNYRVQAADGAVAVLKVCNSYSAEEVEAQARVSAHLRRHGYAKACAALPCMRGAGFTALADDGTPCCVLSFVEGTAADKVIGAGVEARVVLRSIGEALAQLHRVPVDGEAGLRPMEEGGACDLRKHISGELLALFEASEHTKAHSFLPFYRRQRELLLKAVSARDIPTGVLHGDPFLDNILCDPHTGEVRGFVDLEDVAVGPCLFDAACCACACCFDAATNTLDHPRLRALLEGYYAHRRLSAAEAAIFIDWMKATMLCNASWRFRNFNIDHREIEECRDAHVELQARILELENPETIAKVQALLDEM